MQTVKGRLADFEAQAGFNSPGIIEEKTDDHGLNRHRQDKESGIKADAVSRLILDEVVNRVLGHQRRNVLEQRHGCQNESQQNKFTAKLSGEPEKAFPHADIDRLIKNLFLWLAHGFTSC